MKEVNSFFSFETLLWTLPNAGCFDAGCKNHSVLVVNCFDAGPDIYIVLNAGCFDAGCNTDSVRILLVTVSSSRPVLRAPLRPIRPGMNHD